jgi:hypothetical protein
MRQVAGKGGCWEGERLTRGRQSLKKAEKRKKKQGEKAVVIDQQSLIK